MLAGTMTREPHAMLYIFGVPHEVSIVRELPRGYEIRNLSALPFRVKPGARVTAPQATTIVARSQVELHD
jgi:hypothetical protein